VPLPPESLCRRRAGTIVSSLPGTDLFFAADPDARPVAEELIGDIGIGPVYVGDAGATGTVDGLLPLWLALVQRHGGNRRLALRIVR